MLSRGRQAPVGRLRDRLANATHQIVIEGPSYRVKLAPERREVPTVYNGALHHATFLSRRVAQWLLRPRLKCLDYRRGQSAVLTTPEPNFPRFQLSKFIRVGNGISGSTRIDIDWRTTVFTGCGRTRS